MRAVLQWKLQSNLQKQAVEESTVESITETDKEEANVSIAETKSGN